MKQYLNFAAVPVLLLVAGAAWTHDHDSDVFRISAELQPTSEVPAVSSVAHGSFKATVDTVNQTITYELTYDGLEAAPLQSHIHVGQKSVNGGVSVFLCGNPPTVPPAAFPQPPACPTTMPAVVTGVITAASVVGPAGQGIAPTSATANEFAELVELLRSGDTYANVHSSKFPGGEIRGQVRHGFGHKDKDGKDD
jgi:hypothetical protein